MENKELKLKRFKGKTFSYAEAEQVTDFVNKNNVDVVSIIQAYGLYILFYY